MKLLRICAVLCILAAPAYAQYQKAQGWCEVGGVKVAVPGTGGSSSKFQQSAASCTATVYYTGLSGAVSITSIARATNVVTLTFAQSVAAAVPGASLTVAGVSDATFDGNFIVLTVAGTVVTYAQTAGNASSSGGTGTLSPLLYTTTTGTAKANPFTAASNGLWFFYADPTAHYDIVLSGGGLASPVTLSDYAVNTNSSLLPGTVGTAGQQPTVNPGATAAPFQTKALLDVRDSSSGTVAGRIDAQCAAGAPGGVVIPGTVGTGNSTALADACAVADYRGLTAPDGGANEGSGFPSAFLFRERRTASLTTSPTNALFYFEPFSGGVNNSGGPKTNYSNVQVTTAARTQGQTNGINVNHIHYSNGDTFGIGAIAQSWGGLNASGDEGTTGIGAVAYQGDTEFSGTITAINGTQLTWGSGTNAYSRGENRPILNTTAGKFYSTGTVTGISGSTVTFSGSTISGFCTGAQSNTVWFVLDSEVRESMKYAMPVASCDSNTQVTLVQDYNAQTSTGTYKLYNGSLMSLTSADTGGGNSSTGTFHVASASAFATSDTFTQPVDYRYSGRGASVSLWKHTGTITDVGEQINNIGTFPAVAAYEATGPFQYGMHFPSAATFSQAVLNIGGLSGTVPAVYVSDVTDNQNRYLFSVNRNSGSGIASLIYIRATDNWAFGGGAVINAGSGAASFTTSTATTQFSGPGTGITGTASGLNIGGNAATATALEATPASAAGHATCWKAAGVLGYCSTQPDAGGACTCN